MKAETTETTTPWDEFNSYLDCCISLGVEPRVGAWARYQRIYGSRW